MPYRIVKLTPDLCDFVQIRIESGRYENAGELVRAALRALHREEINSRARQRQDGIAQGDVFRKLWEVSAESSQIPR